MAKAFAPRVAKKERKELDLSDKMTRDLFKWGDEKLLQGITLNEIDLKEIHVKEQVRTKFNDNSLQELAQNILLNGLIQPLVVHKKDGKHVLICGERRFRAMGLIKKEKAPCYILEGKTDEELMAIQFSENSAREELHYIDKADGILNYHLATGASERNIQKALNISKSEVHRGLIIGRMPKALKEAAKKYDVEKYVLVEWDDLKVAAVKELLAEQILIGQITKRTQLKKAMTAHLGPKQRTKALKTQAELDLSY